MEDADKKEAMQSIHRAAKVLDYIGEGVHSMTEIGDHCGLSKSTTHRLLQALIKSGLVTQDPVNRQYYLGYTITHLIARPQITHEYLVMSAKNEIKRLADFTGETVSFGIMIALRYVNLYSIPSTYNLRAVEEPQPAGSIHAGAHGRVLLSQLNSKELKTVVKSIQFNPVIEYANVDPSKLMEQIELIRVQGYAISSNERTTGVTCLAAPVKNYGLPAVLYVLGPDSRVKPRVTEFLDNLLTSVNRISNNVAHIFSIR
jgi:DNA-binding IclR family transcriptional regulator